MEWLKRAKDRRDERIELVRLREDEATVLSAFKKQVAEAGAVPASREWRSIHSQFENELSLIRANIGEIETRKTLRMAGKWDVPVPPPPYYSSDGHPYWSWHGVHARYYINEDGKAFVRREVYAERDMRSRPYLAWAAIAISVVSLAVAALKP